MKITLIRPPKYFKGGASDDTLNYALPPIGIASISSFLKSKGVDVEVLDLYFEDIQLAKKKLMNISTDVAGFTCLTGEHQNSLYAAQLIKENSRPAPFVVLGGPHASAANFDELILRNYHFIDFVIRGEGEISTFELLEALGGRRDLESVKGLSFRKNGHYMHNSDRAMLSNLDGLPFPDYTFYDFSKQAGGNYDGHFFLRNVTPFKFAPIVSSRGCPNRCQFCSLFWGNMVRLRSAKNMLEEINNVMHQFDITHFSFFDDCFNISLDRIKDFCQRIIDQRLKISWTAMVRVKPLDIETLKCMRAAGCYGLCIGVESGSKQILKTIGKNITKEEISKIFHLAKKVGIKTKMLLMVGNLGERPSTVRDTQSLIRRCRPTSIGISPLVVLPNSGIYDSLLAKGRIKDEYWLTHSRPPCYTEEHRYDVLRYYRFKLLSSFYASKGSFLKLIKVYALQLIFLILIKQRIDANNVQRRLYELPWLRPLLQRIRTVE